MGLLWSFVAVGGMLVVGLGIFGLIKRVPALRMATKTGAVIMLCSGLGTCTLGTLAYSVTPEAAKARAEEAAAADRAAKEKAAAAAKLAADNKAVLPLQAETFWSEVKGATNLCDEEAAEAGRVIDRVAGGGASMVDAYDQVDRAEGACSDASVKLAGVRIPPTAEGDLKKEFEDAKETCSQGYLMKQVAMSRLKDIVNGDTRPSAVSTFRERLATAQAGTTLCVLKVSAAGEKVGYKLPELEAAKAKARKQAD